MTVGIKAIVRHFFGIAFIGMIHILTDSHPGSNDEISCTCQADSPHGPGTNQKKPESGDQKLLQTEDVRQ